MTRSWTPAEVAMMDFAEKILRRANEMTQADTDALRTGPDAAYEGLEQRLSDLLPA